MNNIKLKYITLLFIIFKSTTICFSQVNFNDNFDLEGTWIYQSENIEFQTKISEVRILVGGQQKKYLLGVGKLIVDGKVIYNNLNRLSLFDKNGYLEMTSLNELLKQKINPEIMVDAETMEGNYFAYNFSKNVKLKISFYDNMIVLNFPNLLNREGVNLKPDPDHIPAVPSTWILKKMDH